VHVLVAKVNAGQFSEDQIELVFRACAQASLFTWCMVELKDDIGVLAFLSHVVTDMGVRDLFISHVDTNFTAVELVNEVLTTVFSTICKENGMGNVFANAGCSQS